MSDQPLSSGAPTHASWTCPACGRHIPRQVEVCRCGADRNRLEERGLTLEAVPQLHPPAPPSRRALLDSPLGRHLVDRVNWTSTAHNEPRPRFRRPRQRSGRSRFGKYAPLVGYRSDDGVEWTLRMALKGAFAFGVLVVFAVMIAVTQSDPLPRRDNIQILSTLDEFTRDAEPNAPNTIPAFLEQPGSVGLLGPSAPPDELVKALDTADLRDGFCSPSLARQIRHQYPGYYDAWPDEKLEHVVLEKYPEMRDLRCTLSYKVDASPVGVIKYQLKPRSLVESGGLWLLTIVVAGLFAIGGANLYYRLLVDRLSA